MKTPAGGKAESAEGTSLTRERRTLMLRGVPVKSIG